MSLKRNCDGCGAVIEDGKSEANDYPDVAIYIGDSETPTYEYEDLCGECMEILKRRIATIFERPVEIKPEPIPVREEPHDIIEHVPIQEDEPERIAPQEPDIAAEPAAPKVYANGIINQFPIKSMRSNK